MLNFSFPLNLLNTNSELNFALFINQNNPLLMLSKAPNNKSLAHTEQKYCFGYISYDYKNEIEKLISDNYSGIITPYYFISEADMVFKYTNNHWEILHDNKRINLNEFSHYEHETLLNIKLKQRISKEEYICTVNKLKEHIRQGDIYEVNFCLEFYAENVDMNPLGVYAKLYGITRAPYSVLLKHNDIYVLSASPERYIKKTGHQLISQPIKGTAKRGQTDEEDNKLKALLYGSEKERAENVMIVDLVRNDFSKIAKSGSVNVEELCGIYTFETVHQMISTVACHVKEGVSFKDIIHATFPMGSMTGAPKVKAMELIERYEKTKRGIYSGSIGYFLPNGDFDFNVVIRTILYDKKNKYLSFSVGSAITAYADVEKEYEECLLKAQAMKNALGIND